MHIVVFCNTHSIIVIVPLLGLGMDLAASWFASRLYYYFTQFETKMYKLPLVIVINLIN